MTFTFPKSALPPQPSISERMRRDLAAKAGFDALRAIYRKVKEAEKTKADQITQSWRAEAEARLAEQQAARVREQEAETKKRQADQETLLASLPDAKPEWADDPLRELLNDE